MIGFGEGVEQGARDDKFKDWAEEEGEGSESQAELVFTNGQRYCSERLSSEFNAKYLNDNGGNKNDEEEGVVEETLEDVDFR
jgi:hypothetical protein